ncbi:hypothetical protein B5V89_16495 [Heyndrickxia sporothermodurans]|uniref:distal tail protein Dit n=1 Tax=Heyndrickxia sporothermodurans TaxID=46224 RepID=UPI000D34FF8A|nr:distal tail protein Dit [Heyndrickxia sporothermodurans]PTY76927.1 hypothetical protein B5V89_16495 [Heyndrickxia sporothermodurans]
MRTVTYAGVDISRFFLIQKITRSILPPREISTLTVPSRHGAYFTGARYGIRKIDIELTVFGNSPVEYMNIIRFFAYSLDIEEPTELIISDEPDKQYFAILSGDTDMLDELMRIGKGTLTFLCPDPFAYSTTEKTFVPDADNIFLFNNEGTTTTFPKFNVNFQNDATFVSFISPDGVILIGNPSEPSQTVLPKTQYVLNDKMNTTIGWTDAGNALDAERQNAGSVVSVNDAIKASDYGPGTDGAKLWHGPAIRKNLSEQVKDFEVRARMDFYSQDGTSKLDGDQKGRLEVYMFDVSGKKIGKFVMKDVYKHYEFNIPEIYIQNTTFLERQPAAPSGKKEKQKLYTTYTVKKSDTWASIAKKHNMSANDLAKLNGKTTSSKLSAGQKLKVYDKTVVKTVYPTHVGEYNDFYGEFVLSRVGTKWYAEISRMDSNFKKTKTIKKTFYDTGGKFTKAALSYIVIHFAKYDNDPVAQKMQITDLKVLKYNTDKVIDVPAIFQAGDELEVDLTDSSVWLNGDPFMQNVDVASTFFPIVEGETQVKVNSDDPAATYSASFTERYL